MRCLDMRGAVNHPDRLTVPPASARASAARTSGSASPGTRPTTIIVEQVNAPSGRTTAPSPSLFMHRHRPQHLLADPVSVLCRRSDRRTSCLGLPLGRRRATCRACIGHGLHERRLPHRRRARSTLEKRYDRSRVRAAPTSSWSGAYNAARLQRRRLLRPLDRRLHAARRTKLIARRPVAAPGWRAQADVLAARPPRHRRRARGHGHAATSSSTRTCTTTTSWRSGATASTSWPSACKEYPPELGAEIAGVEAEDIRKAAPACTPTANPATIQWGLPVDQTVCRHPAGCRVCAPWAPSAATSTCPGGIMIIRSCAYEQSGLLRLRHAGTSPHEMLAQDASASDATPLHAGWASTPRPTRDTVLHAIETGEPYPDPHAASSSPPTPSPTWPPRPRACTAAMRTVDYIVVASTCS